MSSVPNFKRMADSAAKLDASAPDLVDENRSPSPLVLVCGDQVPFEPVRWLWPGFLPAGMFTVLGGAPGCGKTTIACSLAAILTRAGNWPTGERCREVGDVVLWSGEDAPSVLAARLAAAGADMKRVHFVGDFAKGEPFDPGRDMGALEAVAAKLAAPRLLILDPIVSAVSGDSHKAAEVRRSLQPVVAMAQRLGCAVLGITHFSKGTSGRDPVERVTGSIAFAALARLVLVAAKVKAEGVGDNADDNPGGEPAEPRRVLMRAKSNIGPDDGGLAYRLERVDVAPEVQGQRVQWLEALAGSARELLTDAEAEPNTEREAESNALTDFLRDLLAVGPVDAKGVKAEATGAGYSWASVDRAGRAMGIERRKAGMQGGWTWQLPEGCTKAAKANAHAGLHSSQPSQPSAAAGDDAELL